MEYTESEKNKLSFKLPINICRNFEDLSAIFSIVSKQLRIENIEYNQFGTCERGSNHYIEISFPENHKEMIIEFMTRTLSQLNGKKLVHDPIRKNNFDILEQTLDEVMKKDMEVMRKNEGLKISIV